MDLLLTVLTLIAAVLAVTPRERQLDIRVRIRKFDWLSATIAAVAVVILEFYELLKAHVTWFPATDCWPKGLTPKNAIYLIILMVSLILAARLRFAKLTRSKMSTFRDLVEELYWNGNYGELFALLQTHLSNLFKIYDSDFFFLRLRDKLNPLNFRGHTASLINELARAAGMPPMQTTTSRRLNDWKRRLLQIVSAIAWRIVRLFPVNQEPEESAHDVVRGIFLAPKFLSALAQTRPYLGLDIIKRSKRSFERADFVELFVRELLKDTHSVFYREVQNNQNVSNGRYHLPESNRLLCFFLNDVNVAKELNIYKPIGDYMISDLDSLTRNPTVDTYNRTVDRNFEDVESWHSPLFVGVQFFDIMVKEALFQKMHWHMWLYYMPPVVEGIVRNYRLDDPLVEPQNEFPTRYGVILYRAFSNMRDWILAVEDFPAGQQNVVLKSTAISYSENGNIPKSSIMAITDCLYYVLQAQHVGERTKHSLADLVFNIYFDLRASGKFDAYAQVLATAVTQRKSYKQDQLEYRSLLLRVFNTEKTEYLIKRSTSHVVDLEALLV